MWYWNYCTVCLSVLQLGICELFLFSRQVYATGYMRNRPYRKISISTAQEIKYMQSILRTLLHTFLMKCQWTAIARPHIGMPCPTQPRGR